MSKKSAPFNNPFQTLKLQAEKPKPASAPPPPPKAARAPKKGEVDDDAALFLETVGAVERVAGKNARVPPPPPQPAPAFSPPAEEAESLARLAELVSEEGAFEVTMEPELDGAVHGFDARVRQRLRAGEFSVQAELDLHRLTREEAKPAVERFIQAARIAGHRCVLIVTGKGLNSEGGKAVLRDALGQWLTLGRTGKQVLAFCSAKPKHGGPGAVYVLLRR
jgi:DNA-nicking Smr family endonuclease